VHGTNNVRVENNVTFNTVGHCFFLEDAVETGNQFVHNLGILTKCHPDGKPCVPTDLTLAHQSPAGQAATDILIPSDNTASTFWITNPDNVYRDNVAAGSEATGFWIALPQHPTGAFLEAEGQRQYLAPPDEPARVQRQHRALQFRRRDVRSRPLRRTAGSMSVAPAISAMPIPPTRKASCWCRRSTTTPHTRTATARSGAVARTTCTGT
jgi:hypothetical protein